MMTATIDGRPKTNAPTTVAAGVTPIRMLRLWSTYTRCATVSRPGGGSALDTGVLPFITASCPQSNAASPRRATAHRLDTAQRVPIALFRRPPRRARRDRPPHPLGAQRHVEVAHAEGAQGVHHGVDDSRCRPDGRRFADPLGAE